MTLTYRGLRLVYLLLILVLGGCTTVSEPINDKPIPTPSLTATLENTNSSATTPAPTPTSTEPAPTPGPTITVAPTMTATEIPLPDPTVAMPAPSIAGLENTLLLYTTIADMRTSPNRPPDVAPYDDYWAFRTLPPLPFLDPVIFDTLYGKYQYGDDLSHLFFNIRPQLSPNGRYLLLPGLIGYPEAGFEGTGLWLIDFVGGVTRKLLPDGRFATWNPTSDAITYAAGNVLYTLSIAEGATPTPIFEHPTLSTYAHWSPDGRWIATLTSADPEPTDPDNPQYAAAYWLVPTNGDPARELTVQEAFAIEYSTSDMSWSPDGQYLLVRNKIFDLEGNLLSPDYPGGVDWLPYDSRLLVNGREGLRIMTIAGKEIAHIADSDAEAWAWSRDGQRLAYSLRQEESGVDASILVYDLERGESQVIGVIPQAYYVELLRWSADDSRVIVGLGRNEGDEIWAIDARPGSTAELLLEGALLIEVVPYPVP